MKQQAHRLEDDSVAVRAVIDSMGEGLISIDGEGLITAVNPYTLTALGFTEDELLGQWFSGTIVAVDQHRRPLTHLQRPVVRALTTGEAVSEYTYYLRKDGSMMPVFLTVSATLIDGRPSGAIELFRDITADKQLDIAKEEFVSLASHQLRTPASGVRAILSMLADGDFGELTPKQLEYVTKASQANNRQLQIIEDILSAARIDSGKMELALERTDLAVLITEILAEQASQFEAKAQHIVFKPKVRPVVWADAVKLRMVFDNLLSNASKYTLSGGTITVRLRASGNTAEIFVDDTGIGIPAEDHSRLFAKFSRIDNELSTLVGGSGLGLYLANSIVELHRGHLSVKSKPGQGSSFCVALPFKLGLHQ